MLSNIVSTITSLSFRVNSASLETSSIRSAFVIRSSVRPDLKGTIASAETTVNLYNLLKFQGFCASSFSPRQLRLRGFRHSGFQNALLNLCLHHHAYFHK